MGRLVNAFRPRNVVPAAAWSGSTGSAFGTSGASFQQTTRAYLSNEILSAGINLLATSAGDPHISGRRWRRERPKTRMLQALGVPNNERVVDSLLLLNGFYEEVEDHPLVQLLNNPNPYMSRSQFWSGLVVDYYLAGNAYVIKARTRTGNQVAEFWPVRPDQMKPIPGNMAAGEPFIKGYERTRANGEKAVIPAADVMHFKTRNPLNPYEGISPILALLPRISVDQYMRNFLKSFYENGGAGVGASLNVKGAGKMTQEQKDDFRDRFKRMFSNGQYDVLVSNAEDVTYTPFALNRGLRDALPQEINSVTESRIAMVLKIPGSILGLLIAYDNGSYASHRVAWQVFWDMTMTPLLSDFDDVLNLSLIKSGDFTGIDEVYFDLSDIKALQEDEEALQERARKNVTARIWTMEEGRLKTGIGDLDDNDHFLLPDGTAVKVSELDAKPEEPEPISAPEQLAAAVMRMLPAPHVGRPGLDEDVTARAVWVEASDLKTKNPGMTWGQIAARVGVVERTLRKYRSVFDDDE